MEKDDLSRVPAHVIGDLQAFVTRGRPVTGFLKFVLENDLMAAVTGATEEEFAALPVLCHYIYHKAPVACWGSAAKVHRWIMDLRTAQT